jgi:hypothetical protein
MRSHKNMGKSKETNAKKDSEALPKSEQSDEGQLSKPKS